MPQILVQSKPVSGNQMLGKKKTIKFVQESPGSDSFSESKSLDSENDKPKVLNPAKLKVPEPVNMDTFQEDAVSPLKKQKTMFSNAKMNNKESALLEEKEEEDRVTVKTN